MFGRRLAVAADVRCRAMGAWSRETGPRRLPAQAGTAMVLAAVHHVPLPPAWACDPNDAVPCRRVSLVGVCRKRVRGHRRVHGPWGFVRVYGAGLFRSAKPRRCSRLRPRGRGRARGHSHARGPRGSRACGQGPETRHRSVLATSWPSPVHAASGARARRGARRRASLARACGERRRVRRCKLRLDDPRPCARQAVTCIRPHIRLALPAPARVENGATRTAGSRTRSALFRACEKRRPRPCAPGQPLVLPVGLETGGQDLDHPRTRAACARAHDGWRGSAWHQLADVGDKRGFKHGDRLGSASLRKYRHPPCPCTWRSAWGAPGPKAPAGLSPVHGPEPCGG